jgi:hypothetical protein
MLNKVYLENCEQDWFKKLSDYTTIRFHSISSRLNHTFRFVELRSHNKDSYSYEYASLLRDIGSVFSSVMDGLLKNTRGDARYNIDDFRSYLLEYFSDLEQIYVELGIFDEQRFLYPFRGFSGKKNSSKWWKAFTNVKHFDYECMNEGCLSNIIYSFCALAIIERVMTKYAPSIYDSRDEEDNDIIWVINTPATGIEIDDELLFPEAKYPIIESKK